MKKGGALFLVLLTVLLMQAQEGFHIGVSGTFNSCWILNQNNYGTLAPFTQPVIRTSEMDYKYTWGGNGGIVLGYNFHRNWGIQMEFQYNGTGQRYEDAFAGPAIVDSISYGSNTEYVNVKRKIRLQYIEIPIMAKFITSPGRTAKFFMCLGPQFGIRTAAKEEVQVANIDYVYSDIANFSPKEKFKILDVGIALQLGTEVYLTDNLYMDIGMNVYGGITDLNGKVLKTLGWYSQNDVEYQDSHNFRVGLMAGIHYIIGRGRIDY